MFFALANGKGMIRLGEPEGLYFDKASFSLANLLLLANQCIEQQVLPSMLFTLSLFDFLSIPAKHNQMGISVIFKNMGVNLAFRLHRHVKNTL